MSEICLGNFFPP